MGRLATTLKRAGFWDDLVRRNPLFYSRARCILSEFDQWSPERRTSWVQERLQGILDAARRTPYGRRVSAPASLERWPVLEKEQIRAEATAFFNAPEFLGVPASTSGTTGTPLRLLRSFESIAYEQAVLDHLFAQAGLDAATCRVAVLRGDDIKPLADRNPPFWRLANNGRRLLFSTNHLDAQTVGDFVGALREFAPHAIVAYPTALDPLCALMAKRGERVSVPFTLCSSEVLTAETAAVAREVLNTHVVDYYGQAERVSFAYGNPFEGYRFLASYSVNELVEVQSTGDSSVCELISTGLWNKAMPLVRYRTGDRILLRRGSDPAAVAAGRETFLGIIGRSEDYLVSPTGARLIALNHVPRDVPGVLRMQFVQEAPDLVTVRLVPAPGFSDESRKILLRQAARKLPPSMHVRIELTTDLVRNSSGKAPLVIRRF